MRVLSFLNRAAPLIAFLLGIWYFCIRILGYGFEFIPGDMGDSRFINYLLEHAYRWFSGDVAYFWDAGFMYPFENTIALSDTMLGTAPFYAAWRVLGFSPETSYQIWWITMCTLNYWISYTIFRKWLGRADLAIVLAYIFAFTLFNLGQLNFMQMIIRFVIPLVFYAGYKMLETPSLKYLAIYVFGIVFQFYSIIYTGFYLMYFSVLFLLIYMAISKKWKAVLFYFSRKKVAYTSAILVVALLAMGWLFIPYLNMSKMTGMLRYNDIKVNLPVALTFLFPHYSTITWRFLFDVARPGVETWWLHHLYTGIVPFTVMVASPFYLLYRTLKKIKTPAVLSALILSSLVIVLMHVRTYDGLSFYKWALALPGIGSMRVLNRFMHVELFILLLILGMFLTRVKAHAKTMLVLGLLVFADNLFSPEHLVREEKSEIIQRREALVDRVKSKDYKKYAAVAFLDSTQSAFKTNIDIMIVAQELGIKTINGYSSYCPPELVDFSKNCTRQGLVNWLDDQHLQEKDILLIYRDNNESPGEVAR